MPTFFLKTRSIDIMTRNTTQKGRQGEEIAIRYLTQKGYVVKAQNYRFKRFEIDIITQNQEILVFVEVKFHENSGFGLPEESVSTAQQAQILEAAEQYIWEINWQNDVRFDIIAIQTSVNDGFKIQHFEDAFY